MPLTLVGLFPPEFPAPSLAKAGKPHDELVGYAAEAAQHIHKVFDGLRRNARSEPESAK
jgi:hypothetical protein